MPEIGEIREMKTFQSNSIKPGDFVKEVEILKVYRKYNGKEWATYAYCKCYCGKEFEKRMSDLKASEHPSCGCYSIINHTRTKDITGEIYNGCEALRFHHMADNGAAIWVFRCPRCGDEFIARPNNVKIGHTTSCKKCKYRTDFSGYINKHGVEILKYLYTDDNSKSIWLCKCPLCGKEFEGRASDVKSGRITSCGCRIQSIGAQKCEELLINYFGKINVIKEDRIPECKGDNRSLPFDFHIITKEYNYMVEYDGILHYKAKEGRGGEEELKTRQRYDKIKNEYCLQHNIPIIRIPYTVPVDDITLSDLIPSTSKFLVK